MLKRLAWIAPLLVATTAFGLTVDVTFYKSGTTEKIVGSLTPGQKANVDVVLTLYGAGEFLTGYEMDFVDGTSYGPTTPGLSLASITDRTLRTGWGDLTNSSFPVSMWTTPLDAAAYATNSAYDLAASATGASYVVETLALTVPASFDAGVYLFKLRPQDTGLLFTGRGGVAATVGNTDGASVTITPEPGSIMLLSIAAIGLLRRR